MGTRARIRRGHDFTSGVWCEGCAEVSSPHSRGFAFPATTKPPKNQGRMRRWQQLLQHPGRTARGAPRRMHTPSWSAQRVHSGAPCILCTGVNWRLCARHLYCTYAAYIICSKHHHGSGRRLHLVGPPQIPALAADLLHIGTGEKNDKKDYNVGRQARVLFRFAVMAADDICP